jgi:hypothetical protein
MKEFKISVSTMKEPQHSEEDYVSLKRRLRRNKSQEKPIVVDTLFALEAPRCIKTLKRDSGGKG